MDGEVFLAVMSLGIALVWLPFALGAFFVDSVLADPVKRESWARRRGVHPLNALRGGAGRGPRVAQAH